MSVTSKLEVYKATGITTHTFIEIIKTFPEVKPEETVRSTMNESSFFKFSFNDEARQLQIHQGYNSFSISLSSWGSDEEILRRIAAITGGFLSLNDSESYEKIMPVTEGNLEYSLMRAKILGVFKSSTSYEDQKKAFINFLKSEQIDLH